MTAQPKHPGAVGPAKPLHQIIKTHPLRVMTEDDWQQWITHGYVVIRNLIPASLIEQVRQAVWAFEEMDPDDPTTWSKRQRRDHKMTELNNTGMVEMYHHPAMWQVRQHRAMYDLFVDIWDREDLWVSIDRANLNTPNRGPRALTDDQGFIHFDVDSSATPLPVSVQGVLALSDQDAETGGFQCVPGIFRDFDWWRSHQPAGVDPYHPDVSGYDIAPVPLNAGDMLVFNALLPHGVRPNGSMNRARMAQYVSMFPAQPEDRRLVDERIHLWAHRQAPAGDAFPGDPRGKETFEYGPAELSALGRRLLGLDEW
ncbi:phytanoyl-CoA dioxygenase family protein [Reinekea blandensis]|uniref:Phytanoyl-CoA dioxygenase n=1 Tax=Reinekea blandensis MED297 TaxID=314283 RepID=A4BBA7_9GAMM|nr:phytanoyl-CoA dioxygenase family protein [Reinekea blandensis]EAR10720.1 hypothetical protein MED297_11910 [Reinekea sp. MED297] [Reinekea blandensis MED297]